MIFLLLFCFLPICLYFYFTRTFDYWKKKGIKGPKPMVLFGNFKDVTLMRDLETFEMKKICNEYRNEPLLGVYRMTCPWLVVKDLDMIKHILIKDFDLFSDRGVPLTDKKLNRNLFSSETETWRVLRHQFTPLFTSGKLKNMLHLITERGDKFLDYVDEVTKTEPDQELHGLIQLYTLSTIAACAFGIDVDLTTNNSFLSSLRDVDDLIFKRRSIQDIIIMYPNLFLNLRSLKFARNLNNFFEDLVATVMKQRNGKSINRHDFMDLILDLRSKGKISGPKREDSKELTLEITDDIIAAQAFVFYAAGYETSATTMSFMLYELARNPNIQEKLHQEIDEVLGSSNGEVTYDTLSKLPYMEKVFDETLRVYPLVDPLQRRAKSEYRIPGTDITIEKGQIVVVPVRYIHYDETIYPNPEKFDPERFDTKVSAARHACAYMPFGLGPRNCIGMRFAKVQSRVCILKLLSRFRVELMDDQNMTFDWKRAIISPRKGYKLKFCARKNMCK
ncbi:cytochrome P450 6B5-like [Aricia agestis]|uniref:cytochrome P450 6B5-like n=1 Tax=Aricia agestis TaxID=91739 RepID=UPI001C207B3C|nr:cytochrome P450 6B5-like [Aricia agestis]